MFVPCVCEVMCFNITSYHFLIFNCNIEPKGEVYQYFRLSVLPPVENKQIMTQEIF